MTSKIESSQTSDSAAEDIPTQCEGYRCSNKNTSAPKVLQKSSANCASTPTSEFYNQQITDTFNRLKEIFPAEATEEHRNQLWNIAETA
jgi:hypothetical protein